METEGIRKRVQARRFVLIGMGLLLVVVFAFVTLQLLIPQGWSKDTVLDDGRMRIRVQFQAEPDPPTVGVQTLMVKVKNDAGYPMSVDHVHFTISKNGQTVAETMEGIPVGNFGATADGFYTARVELTSQGTYQVDIAVQHNQSRFNLNWPLEVS